MSESKEEKQVSTLDFNKIKTKVKGYVEIIKDLAEAFQAFLGKKPLRQKVAVLASPENPQGMSILTNSQARFVALSKFVAGVEEWGGLFQGLSDYADQVMNTSPSIGGEGREQVIRFVGALAESKVFKELALTAQKVEKKD